LNSLIGCGAIFMGLNTGVGGTPASQLVLNCVWFIEKVPNFYDQLIVMASMSAPYDPHAIRIYSQVVQAMPPGVPRAENPLGEWFSKVMGLVRKFAIPVGAALGGAFGDPVAGAEAGAIISGAAGLLGRGHKRRRVF